MTFHELPTSKKVLLIAHAMSAFCTCISAIGQLIELAERDSLPNEIPRGTSFGDTRAREYFR